VSKPATMQLLHLSGDTSAYICIIQMIDVGSIYFLTN